MTRSSTIAAAVLDGIVTLGAVGVGAAVVPNIAGAQTDTTAVPAGEAAPAADGAAGRLQGHPRLRQLAREEGRVAAETIGISPEELRVAVRDGQSIAEVAQDNGVEPQAVIDAVVADLGGRLDRAVADGKITQERADRVAERLPTRVENLVNRHRVAGSRG